MRVDLLAGTAYTPAAMPAPVPTILVFDSGLGGLTVFAEALNARPDARFVYAADDAGFPYGRLTPETLVVRVIAVIRRLIETYRFHKSWVTSVAVAPDGMTAAAGSDDYTVVLWDLADV